MKQRDDMDMRSKIDEIERLIRDFKEKFEAGTSDAENFMTMHEIERMWSELREGTDYIYSDIVSELMGQVDEKDLIRKKKVSTEKKALP
jgi:hypothetical protein